jgi:hypothetical protein
LQPVNFTEKEKSASTHLFKAYNNFALSFRKVEYSRRLKLDKEPVLRDPDPDPNVFWPPGSVSISQRHGSGSGSFPFLITANKACKINFNTKF